MLDLGIYIAVSLVYLGFRDIYSRELSLCWIQGYIPDIYLIYTLGSLVYPGFRDIYGLEFSLSWIQVYIQ